jgi:hypothetical protein
MRKRFILLLILIFMSGSVFSQTGQYRVDTLNGPAIFDFGDTLNLSLKVIKIKREQGYLTTTKKRSIVYVVYATRENKFYKILSPFNGCTYKNGTKIREGHTYNLLIQSLFAKKINGINIVPPGSSIETGVSFQGLEFSIEPTKYMDIFQVYNLNGKYIRK